MTQKIEIILAENHELFRKSLVALLKTKPEFDVVAEASNSRELINQLKQKPVDIVLLDIEMPVMNTKRTLEIIGKRFPQVKVIILNIHSNMNLVSDFMAQGASGYLRKSCDVQTLFRAIQVVNYEGYFFDNVVSKALLDSVIDKSQNTVFSEIKFNYREAEIVTKICDGKTNKEIASSLNLSTSAIDFHKSKIYSKTNCSNATELLRYALKNGIVALS